MDSYKRDSIISQVDLLDYVIKSGIYEKEKITNGYLITPCPKCDSPKKPDDPGHFIIYPETNSYSSFSKCCQGGTIFDYLEELENLSKADAILKAEKLAGIANTREPQEALKQVKNTNARLTEKNADFASYYEELKANDNTPAREYLIKKREIEAEAIPEDVFFDKKFNSIIFPVTANHCIYRSLNSNGKGNKPGSKSDIYNKALLDSEVGEIFITESIIDGLSLNRSFISLNSISNKDKLIQNIKQSKKAKEKRFILALDNDKQGIETRNHITEEFKKMNVNYVFFSFNRKFKDINEYKRTFPSEFKQKLDNKEYLKPDLVNNYLSQFYDDIAKEKTPAISTGFKELDKELDGGLHAGLYVIGAISSLGKTTFIQNITDNMALEGQDVLFFSLEMSKFEMIGKSFSRFIFQKTKDKETALTTRQILSDISGLEMMLDSGASLKYDKISKHLSIIEGGFETDLIEIKNKIENYVKFTGSKPVIVIDYLQILQAGSDKGTEKQKIDYLTTELKRISRKNNLTVIVISSFNRENYQSGVGFESFKESGSIEYTADVVFGLQLEAVNSLERGAGKTTENREIINEAKAEFPRKTELVCLKNRNGKSYFKIGYSFYSKFNFFKEDEEKF